MTPLSKKRVEELYHITGSSKIFSFSCHLCKLVAYPNDCHDCPVYVQSFCDD